MLFSAIILVCLTGEPHTYQSCELVISNFKYKTEEQCWMAVLEKARSWKEFPGIGEPGQYEPVAADCKDWLSGQLI